MFGAGTTNRTRDLLITSQLLYQLSYAGLIAFNQPPERLARNFSGSSEGANFIVFILGWQALGRNLADTVVEFGLFQQTQ